MKNYELPLAYGFDEGTQDNWQVFAGGFSSIEECHEYAKAMNHANRIGFNIIDNEGNIVDLHEYYMYEQRKRLERTSLNLDCGSDTQHILHNKDFSNRFFDGTVYEPVQSYNCDYTGVIMPTSCEFMYFENCNLTDADFRNYAGKVEIVNCLIVGIKLPENQELFEVNNTTYDPTFVGELGYYAISTYSRSKKGFKSPMDAYKYASEHDYTAERNFRIYNHSNGRVVDIQRMLDEISKQKENTVHSCSKHTDTTVVAFTKNGVMDYRCGNQYMPQGATVFAIFRAVKQGLLVVEVCDNASILEFFLKFQINIFEHLEIQKDKRKLLLCANSAYNTNSETLELFTLI